MFTECICSWAHELSSDGFKKSTTHGLTKDGKEIYTHLEACSRHRYQLAWRRATTVTEPLEFSIGFSSPTRHSGGSWQFWVSVPPPGRRQRTRTSPSPAHMAGLYLKREKINKMRSMPKRSSDTEIPTTKHSRILIPFSLVKINK